MVRNAGCMDWTDAAIARLKELWGEGFSASECGQRMGVSRNSVIGKIHRLGLSGKYRRPRERGRRMTKASASKLAAQKSPNNEQPPASRDLSEEPKRGSFDLLDLKFGQCRWPEGDGPYRFCGAPQVFDSSYCKAHHAMAHASGGQRAADRAAEQALAGKLFASRAGVDEAA
jgi:GcrA cell cycle regulator